MKPLVSVIMPAYNGAKYIRKSIDGIIQQSYDNWELIIVEDCSTDETSKIVDSYEDKRICVYRNEKNRGIAFSTNLAIEKSQGKYIALNDDDDISTSIRLEKEVTYLEEHKDIDIVGGRTIYIDTEDNITGYSLIPRFNPNYNKVMLLFGGVSFSNSTAMIRKDFIIKNHIKYMDNCCGMQDVRFYMECSKVGKISAMDNFFLKYRMHQENETTKYMTKFKDKRAAKFAELQEWSLKASGFKLSKDDLQTIHYYISEDGNACNNIQELKNLYNVLRKVYTQAIEMNADYINELNHFLRRKLVDQVMKASFIL